MNVEVIVGNLIDEGKLLQGGFDSYRAILIPPDASMALIDALHFAFFAGAQHLFASIVTILGPDEEPTDKEMARMDSIEKELSDWAEGLKLRAMKTGGSA